MFRRLSEVGAVDVVCQLTVVGDASFVETEALIVRRSQRWFITVMWAILAIAGSWVAIWSWRIPASAVNAAVALVFAGLAVASARGGLFVDRDGVFARGVERQVRLPWGCIRAFELHEGRPPLGTKAGLYAVTADGARKRMLAGGDSVPEGTYHRALARLDSELTARQA